MSKEQPAKKYRINLPNTPFPMKASLSQREPERLKKWEGEDLTGRIFQEAAKAKEKFILHDGPPYANGHIHIGHALNKILKDVIVKYKTMQGFNARYVPGWDCHGLPIEHALFKELGKRKEQVDQIHFRKEARKYAQKFVAIQREEFKRLGVFGDWEDPYLTMSASYQTSIARSFYELFEKGYIVRGEKPIHWCFDCETALAEAELEYQDKTSVAIFVSFRITEMSKEQKKTVAALGAPETLPISFLIWTTTPWTLPANVGIALHPDLEYGLYLHEGKEIFIFTTALEANLKEKLKLGDLKCLKRYRGSELKDVFPSYQHPFVERRGNVILADYVSSTDGTGIVHIAPGHGQEDYVHGHLIHKLPVESPVDHKGQFTEDFGSSLPLKGQHVFRSNQPIVEHLETIGHLKGKEEHPHSYPHCWRCKKPVIFRSTPQWFLKIDHEDLRKRVMAAIENSQATQWYPDWGKNRILGMLTTRPDWCLSRQRLWGVPIPIAYCADCHEPYYTQAMRDKVLSIFEQETSDAWFERPASDFFPKEAKCRKCSCQNLKLERDILDVWFDSGVSHQAVLEHGAKLGYPCAMYLEGSDQHRGWFQTSLITAVALRNSSPFKNVLTHGFVVDGQGKKMSKSQGNVVSPQEIFKTYGADVLRLWVSSCDTDVDVRLSPEILERMAEAYRKIRNTFRYLLGNLTGFDPAKHQVAFKDMDSIDRWALTRLKQVAGEVIQCYEEYKFHRIYQIVYDFCITDLSAFYLDVLKDRLYTKHPDDPLRRGSQTALFIIGKSLVQLMAPILSFTADEVWESFPFGEEKSVHESLWDPDLWKYEDEASFRKWNAIRELRKSSDLEIEKLREAKEIGSSLECQVILSASTRDAADFLQKNELELRLGLIVSRVVLGEIEKGKGHAFPWQYPALEGLARDCEITLSVKKALGAKCARCWKYSGDVGMLADPQLCGECAPVELALNSQT